MSGLKRRVASWPLLINCALECFVRKVQKSQEELELNGIYQLLVCADDINLLSGNLNTTKENILSSFCTLASRLV
jgi:hypothetical protein